MRQGLKISKIRNFYKYFYLFNKFINGSSNKYKNMPNSFYRSNFFFILITFSSKSCFFAMTHQTKIKFEQVFFQLKLFTRKSFLPITSNYIKNFLIYFSYLPVSEVERTYNRLYNPRPVYKRLTSRQRVPIHSICAISRFDACEIQVFNTTSRTRERFTPLTWPSYGKSAGRYTKYLSYARCTKKKKNFRKKSILFTWAWSDWNFTICDNIRNQMSFFYSFKAIIKKKLLCFYNFLFIRKKNFFLHKSFINPIKCLNFWKLMRFFSFVFIKIIYNGK